jgi:hypothetical protein
MKDMPVSSILTYLDEEARAIDIRKNDNSNVQRGQSSILCYRTPKTRPFEGQASSMERKLMRYRNFRSIQRLSHGILPWPTFHGVY